MIGEVVTASNVLASRSTFDPTMTSELSPSSVRARADCAAEGLNGVDDMGDVLDKAASGIIKALNASRVIRRKAFVEDIADVYN